MLCGILPGGLSSSPVLLLPLSTWTPTTTKNKQDKALSRIFKPILEYLPNVQTTAPQGTKH